MARATQARLTHDMYADLRQWCAQNIAAIKGQQYQQVADMASAALGFTVASTSIGEVARKLGFARHPESNGKPYAGSISSKRATETYRALEEIYEALDMKTPQRNAMRDAFGVQPLQMPAQLKLK